MAIIGLPQHISEADIWEYATKHGDGHVWDVHVLRNEGRSRGIATIIFDEWADANSFKREYDGADWCDQRIKIRWDRDWTAIRRKGGFPGEYPIELNDRDRKTIVI